MNLSLTVAAAQTFAVPGNIAANVDRHLVFVDVAAANEVQLLLFPELSLTGYEPTLARAAGVAPGDVRLEPLRKAACQSGVTVVAGAPLWLDGELKIGALAFAPDGSMTIYAKQHLHPGEDEVFSPGRRGVCLTLGSARAALAICADITHAEHPEQAADLGAQLYAAAVLLSERGYPAETATLRGYARQHKMAVLLANYGGPTGGWMPAGKSAFWSEDGDVVAVAPSSGEQLVIASNSGYGWSGAVLAV